MKEMDIQNIQQMQNKIMRIILYYRKDTEGEGGGERERERYECNNLCRDQISYSVYIFTYT